MFFQSLNAIVQRVDGDFAILSGVVVPLRRLGGKILLRRVKAILEFIGCRRLGPLGQDLGDIPYAEYSLQSLEIGSGPR